MLTNMQSAVVRAMQASSKGAGATADLALQWQACLYLLHTQSFLRAQGRASVWKKPVLRRKSQSEKDVEARCSLRAD